MITSWHNCKNILMIRPDNMGDLLMSGPAIRAVKKSFSCSVTLLASSAGAAVAPYLPDVDHVIISDVPWVRTDNCMTSQSWNELVREIAGYHFDGAIVFTVFSQNPMPSIMLAWLAGIPNRLAYCRENPYHLLSDWVADQEPYSLIRHQVERDLFLVSAIGASPSEDQLLLAVPADAFATLAVKLSEAGIDTSQPWLVIHPGASEIKRQYPVHLFKEIILKIIDELGMQVMLTGTASEKPITDLLSEAIESSLCYSLAGKFSLQEFMALIDLAPAVLSVNTGTIHIASALQTPVVVLYANTNPQHTPWRVAHEVIFFPVIEHLRSKNEIIRYVQDHVMKPCSYPDPQTVVESVRRMSKTNTVRHQLPE